MQQILTFVLVFCGLLGFGQEYQKTFDTAKSLRFQQKDSSLLLVNDLLEHVDQIDPALVYDVFRLKCQIHTDALALKDAHISINKGLQWAEKYNQKENIKNAYLNKAYVKRLGGELDSAMIFINESFVDCSSCIANINELGHIYYDQGQIDQAIEQHKKAYEIAIDQENYLHKVISLKHLVDMYNEKKDVENFNVYLIKLLEISDLNFESPGILSLHGELASFYFNKDNIAFYEASVNKLKDGKSLRSHYLMASRIIAYYHANKQWRKAEKLLTEIIQTIEDNQDLKQRTVFYYLLYQNMKNQGRISEALQAFEIYEEENSKFIKLDLQEKTRELEIKYETKRKDAEIRKQELEIQQKTTQRNNLIRGIGFLLLLGVSLIWGIYSRMQRNKRISLQEKELQNQRYNALEQDQKLLSMASVLEGQETERIRIAKDLHDGLGGLLTNVKTHFGKIQSEIEKVESLDIYKSANQMIDKAHDEVRRISHNLMPSDLRAGGLPVAVRQLVHEMKTVHELNTDFEMIGFNDARIDEKVELSSYRIIQELINNMLKYANANHAFIQISKFENEIQIVVEDDGVGFDYEKELESSGLGLKSIQNRVDQLGGHMDVVSSDGRGTSVTINIPI